VDAKQIKKFLIDKELTVTDIADAIKEDRTAVSRVLNYERATERIRRKLRRRFGIVFEDSATQKQAA
jgi:predicted transcriptional regulator